MRFAGLRLPRRRGYREQTRAERDIDRLEREIDELVYQVYGLTEEEVGIVEGYIECKKARIGSSGSSLTWQEIDAVSALSVLIVRMKGVSSSFSVLHR
jgi:hypothetical protein